VCGNGSGGFPCPGHFDGRPWGRACVGDELNKPTLP
jgi:hypothetical protein